MAFSFGEACRFVADLVANVKKQLTSYVHHFFAKPKTKVSPPVQLFLDLIFSKSPLCTPNLDPNF